MTTKRPRMGIFPLARQVSSQKTGDMKGAIDYSLSWLSLPTRLRQVKSYRLVNLWLSNKVVYIARTWEAICDSNPSFLSASSWIKERGGGRLKRNDCGSAMEVKITWNTVKKPFQEIGTQNWPLIMTTTWSALAGSSLQLPPPPPLPFPSPQHCCVPKKRPITRLVLLKSQHCLGWEWGRR